MGFRFISFADHNKKLRIIFKRWCSWFLRVEGTGGPAGGKEPCGARSSPVLRHPQRNMGGAFVCFIPRFVIFLCCVVLILCTLGRRWTNHRRHSQNSVVRQPGVCGERSSSDFSQSHLLVHLYLVTMHWRDDVMSQSTWMKGCSKN